MVVGEGEGVKIGWFFPELLRTEGRGGVFFPL